MSFGRLGYYRSPEQLGHMNDGDWIVLLGQLLELKNAEGFAAICELFAVWPIGPERSRHLAVTLQRMENWDEKIRTVSSAYTYLYQGSQLSDVARLARSIEIYRREESASSSLMAIATSQYVSELLSLSIVASEISTSAWNALLTTQHLGRLRRLVLQNSSLDRNNVPNLFRSRSLPELQTLELSAMGLTAANLPLIQPTMPFVHLERFDFSHNVLRTDGAVQLAGAPWFKQVRWLAIRDNFVSRPGIEALIESPFARELTIDARDNKIPVAETQVLIASAGRKRIRLLL